MHEFTDRTGQQAAALLAGIGGDLLHPFHAEAGNFLHNRVAADAAESTVIAAGNEAFPAAILVQPQNRAVMHRDLPPLRRIGNADQTQRTVPERKRDNGAGTIEHRANHKSPQRTLNATALHQEIRRRGLAHAMGPWC